MRGGSGSIGQGSAAAALIGAPAALLSAEDIRQALALRARLRCSWLALAKMVGRNEQTLRAACEQFGAVEPGRPAPVAPMVRAAAPEVGRVGRILRDVAAERGCTVVEILADNRCDAVVSARFEIVARLDAAGLTRAQIGRAVQRDPTTVAHAMRNRRRQRQAPTAMQRGGHLLPLLAAAERDGGTARAVREIARLVGMTPGAAGWRFRALSRSHPAWVVRTGGIGAACWKLSATGWCYVETLEAGLSGPDGAP